MAADFMTADPTDAGTTATGMLVTHMKDAGSWAAASKGVVATTVAAAATTAAVVGTMVAVARMVEADTAAAMADTANALPGAPGFAPVLRALTWGPLRLRLMRITPKKKGRAGMPARFNT